MKLVHQRASTGKLNKSTVFGNQYTKELQQESQINQQPLETRTNNKFNLLRNNMIIELNMLDMGGLPVNIDILLFGNDDLSVEINTFIFSCVQKYIKDTRHFS